MKPSEHTLKTWAAAVRERGYCHAWDQRFKTVHLAWLYWEWRITWENARNKARSAAGLVATQRLEQL